MATRKQTLRGRFYETSDGTFPSVTTILGVIGKPALINWAASTERELVLECSANLYEDIHGTPKMSRTAWLTTMQTRLGSEKAHKRELAKAGEIGSQAHALIEWVLRTRLMQKVGPSPRISEKAQWSFMAWEDFAKAVVLKPVHIEQTVYSKTFGYAGTTDLTAEVNLVGLIRWFEKKALPVPSVLIRLSEKNEIARALIDWKTGKGVYSEAHLQNGAYRHAIREMGHFDAELGLIVRLPKVESDPEFEIVVADDESESLEVFLHFKAGWEWNQRKDKWLAEQEQKEQTAA